MKTVEGKNIKKSTWFSEIQDPVKAYVIFLGKWFGKNLNKAKESKQKGF